MNLVEWRNFTARRHHGVITKDLRYVAKHREPEYIIHAKVDIVYFKISRYGSDPHIC